jgi:hypothetical protein
MDSNAGYTLMGSQPVAARVRAMACDSGRSFAASAHLAWHTGTVATAIQAKPATHRIAVPDTNRTRRPRGTP